MTLNIATNPYYDDFDSSKNFQKILFKPGYPVQARELTQLQTILGDQIAKFGNHVFKHGSVVIPGNSTSDLNVCFVKLQSTTVDVSLLENKTVVGGTSGLKGIVRKGINAVGVDPATLYVSYYNSGTSGEKRFLDGENLNIEGISVDVSVLGGTGGASMAFINDGVFFVNGAFVTMLKQSIVIGKYTSSPSCRVLLKIVESIVDSDTDSTLLDPAQGSYNYAAPGADRLKVALVLSVRDLSVNIDSNYIEIMRYNNGTLEEHLRYSKYNELEKALARRTSDESGDYIVSGINSTVREHLKSTLNGGRYLSPFGDTDKLIVTTTAGKAYVAGFEQDIFSDRENIINKSRGEEHLRTITTNISPSYGQTFYVTNVTGLPSFVKKTTVDLYNAPTGGSIIGTAQVVAIDYFAPNTTDTNALFKLCVNNITLTGGNSITDIGMMSFSGGTFTVLSKLNILSTNSVDFVMGEIVSYLGRAATVHKYVRLTGELFVFKHSPGSQTPIIGDTITAPSTAASRVNSVEVVSKGNADNLLVKLPTDSTYRVKNASNITDMSYKIYYETTVTTNGSGAGSFSVTGMTIDPKEQGNFIVSSSNGTILPLSVVTVAPDGLSVSFAGATTSATLKVICAATKSGANAAPKTKTLVTSFSDAGLTPAATISLTRADIVRVISIVSTIDGDVTDRFDLDNGQRDYAYMLGSVTLKPGVLLPTGTITVAYDYFNHNSGSGDYFSVDSYELSGLDNYYETPVLIYKSKNNGKEFDLRDNLDFRSRVGNDNTFTSGSASLSRVVQFESRLSTSIRKYIGRIDAVVLHKTGDINIITGTPAETPLTPVIPEGVLFLCTIDVPPYTFNILDIKIRKQNNRVYQMRDIGKIADRLLSLEEFVLLNESESFAINYDVIDASTGLSRHKSGYLVDTFKDPSTVSDILNPEFRSTYVSGTLIPMFELVETPLVITSQTVQTTGNAITLPYTNSILISQEVSSKITNINPFAVFSWKGRMVLIPEVDVWSEVENLPEVINNITETKTEYVTINRPYSGPLPSPVWIGDLPSTPTFPTVPSPIVPNSSWQRDDTRTNGSGSSEG